MFRFLRVSSEAALEKTIWLANWMCSWRQLCYELDLFPFSPEQRTPKTSCAGIVKKLLAKVWSSQADILGMKGELISPRKLMHCSNLKMEPPCLKRFRDWKSSGYMFNFEMKYIDRILKTWNVSLQETITMATLHLNSVPNLGTKYTERKSCKAKQDVNSNVVLL